MGRIQGCDAPQHEILSHEIPGHGPSTRAEGGKRADADAVTASPAENVTRVAEPFRCILCRA